MNYNMYCNPYGSPCYNPYQSQQKPCPNGPQGYQGAQGVHGYQGPQGLFGQLGPRGVQGPQGQQAQNGSQGYTGYQGPAGINGTSGQTGSTGSTGATGLAGTNGQDFTGPTGLTGAKGPTGLQGPLGPTGYGGNDGANSGIWTLQSQIFTIPTAEGFTTNSLTIANITAFNINVLSVESNNYTQWFQSLLSLYQQGIPVYFELIERGNNATTGIWILNSVPINNGTYFTIFATNNVQLGTLTIGKNYTLSWITHGLPPPCNLVPYKGSNFIPNDRYNINLITGLPTTAEKWVGGVLAPNCKIYYIPYEADSVLILDTTTNNVDITTITVPLGGSKWAGGVLGPNGLIYMIPFDYPDIGVINPETNTLSYIPFVGGSSSNKYYGGVLGPNNKIYCIPYDKQEVLIIDTTTNTTSIIPFTVPSSDMQSALWTGGILAPNGKIYCVPWSSNGILEIDTTLSSVLYVNQSLFIGSGSFANWAGGALGTDGKVYCIPCNSTFVLVIDPNTFSAIPNTGVSVLGISGIPSKNQLWFGGVLGQNGIIYGIPLNINSVLRIDTNTSTTSITTVSNLTGTPPLAQTTVGKYRGGVLGVNGKIYSVPTNTTNIMILNTGTPREPKWMYASEYNKL